MNKTVNDMVREVVEGEGELCSTCGKDKDSFSKEWEYAQCQICSMVEGEGEREYTCSSCGWEIINSKWWLIAQTHSGKYLCDDCEMSLIVSEGV